MIFSSTKKSAKMLCFWQDLIGIFSIFPAPAAPLFALFCYMRQYFSLRRVCKGLCKVHFKSPCVVSGRQQGTLQRCGNRSVCPTHVDLTWLKRDWLRLTLPCTPHTPRDVSFLFGDRVNLTAPAPAALDCPAIFPKAAPAAPHILLTFPMTQGQNQFFFLHFPAGKTFFDFLRAEKIF